MQRESMEFDVLFIGGGPASLAGAIRLMQLAQQRNMEIEVAVIEKGGEIGAHNLSGAILNPMALRELIPDYQDRGCPIETHVRGDEFYFLTPKKAIAVPVVPKQMHNKGFHVISLSRFTRWLGEMAETMGINIFPGFCGKEVLYGSDGKRITGVRTDDKGIGPDGNPKANFEPGLDLLAKVTIFGEGARGHLTESIVRKLHLNAGKNPQVYETGIKEVIQLPDGHYFTSSKGNDIHTFGYPLELKTPGGGFIYEMADNRIALGFLMALSYEDPMMDLYDEFLKFKHHPFVANIIKGGNVVEQGARTVSTGGWSTIPQLAVDGAMFIGACAGIHNPPALKGIHTAMKSGMLAAEAAISAIERNNFSKNSLNAYPLMLQVGWIKSELYNGRNFMPALSMKPPFKFIFLGTQYFKDGKLIPHNMALTSDDKTLKPLIPWKHAEKKPPQPVDGQLYVDKLTGVYLSKTMHREDQPSHLIIHDRTICTNACYYEFRNPCTRFCPGNVYEMEMDETTGQRHLKLNPSNCLHCKTCDIKDPYRNIQWTCPEGGEGPGYSVV